MKFLSILLLITMGVNSCKSKKVTEEKETKISKINFIEDGYSKATIIYDATKSDVCSYLIKLDKGEILEPLKFTNKVFRKNEQLVWVKFNRQRRLGRCSNAQPIELVEIIKRENE
ncbi:MAG: hypothetical protein L3J23_09630 [Flavobacteriaceae bacterium]|nr:hypothetical protein [Flavobacteriaceae bacterium]